MGFFNAAVAMLAALIGFATSVSAQPFPSRPIRIVVPYAPGGSPDLVARTVGHAATEGLGQQIIAENRPGANGVIAAEFVMRSAADGYTLFVADSAHYAMNPHLGSVLPFDMQRDFTPVTLAVVSPVFLVVNSAVPATTVKEFVAYAKEKPGLPFGSSGNGSTHHLILELFKTVPRSI